jgi:ferredoxin
MKTYVDPETCIMCGICPDTCPDIYEMGELSAFVKVDTVPASLEECAVEAEGLCPVNAISHNS